LLHVMRAQAGDRVLLFDGRGGEFLAEVAALGRSQVELRILERRTIDRELPLRAVLGVALPKGDRQAWLVEKAVELGVAELVPLVSERSVAQPLDKALERLRRAVVEASKQCGRNRLMEISAASGWAEFVGSPPQGTICWLADPQASLSAAEALEPLLAGSLPSEWRVAIGPEGGLTSAECELAAAAGWQRVSLGPRTLRVETAALALAALMAVASDAWSRGK
ncbi:MAG TPA: RsmE family RNA methyltransferase, partial [Pirellulales bacterium]|nr:RsmE family RNA methyltransferase [Pirellulales bacterium]